MLESRNAVNDSPAHAQCDSFNRITKVLVLYYSWNASAPVDVKRVPETVTAAVESAAAADSSIPAAAAKQGAERRSGTIDLHLREVAQLFDSLDPCPFYERDLDVEAEEYIVASARELPQRPQVIVVYLDRSSGEADEARNLEKAINQHFARKLKLASRELRVLLRRGWISLLIGLTFLGMLLGLSEVVLRQMTPGPLASVLRESLVIGGWVALWRPLEIFLYEWWPIVGQRKTYAALTRMPVNVVPAHESAH